MQPDALGQQLVVDALRVKVYPDRNALGKAAASEVAAEIKRLSALKEDINMIFAAAPSQNELLDALIAMDDVEFSKITAFHMDEYIGLDKTAEQRFGNFLRQKLFERVRFRRVNYLEPPVDHPESECSRYASLLDPRTIDIVCMGIGENGHIAFNDPPVADFSDLHSVKVVELDEASRLQQVHDKCFPSLDDVPKMAITLTIPSLFRAGFICCVVPGRLKAEAVKRTLRGAITTQCPASILRRHQNATLFLDSDSASFIL
ncbi:MAG: glucosamine-6-phosphate deaminase [Bacteroidota bacterium]